jgi:hypothetical protein
MVVSEGIMSSWCLLHRRDREGERSERERGTYCLRSREGEGCGDLERGRERYLLLEVAKELRHAQTEAQGLCRAQHPATWTSSLAAADPQGRAAAAPPPPHLMPCCPPPRLAPPLLLTGERWRASRGGGDGCWWVEEWRGGEGEGLEERGGWELRERIEGGDGRQRGEGAGWCGRQIIKGREDDQLKVPHIQNFSPPNFRAINFDLYWQFLILSANTSQRRIFTKI